MWSRETTDHTQQSCCVVLRCFAAENLHASLHHVMMICQVLYKTSQTDVAQTDAGKDPAGQPISEDIPPAPSTSLARPADSESDSEPDAAPDAAPLQEPTDTPARQPAPWVRKVTPGNRLMAATSAAGAPAAGRPNAGASAARGPAAGGSGAAALALMPPIPDPAQGSGTEAAASDEPCDGKQQDRQDASATPSDAAARAKAKAAATAPSEAAKAASEAAAKDGAEAAPSAQKADAVAKGKMAQADQAADPNQEPDHVTGTILLQWL